jgi:hypothetical protein
MPDAMLYADTKSHMLAACTTMLVIHVRAFIVHKLHILCSIYVHCAVSMYTCSDLQWICALIRGEPIERARKDRI